MYRVALRQSALLLVGLLVAGCGVPEAAAPPTVAPPISSLPADTPVVASPAPATPLPSPVPAAEPTEGASGQLGYESAYKPLVCENQYLAMAGCQPAATPQMPAVPFDQALRQFNGRPMLFRRYPNFLMLGDSRTGASLWFSGPFCAVEDTQDVYAEWSADRQFIAFSCQDNAYMAATYLLDMQTGAGRQIVRGDAVGFAWSPAGSRLLVASQTDEQRAFILEAATGATTALPAAPYWERDGFPPVSVGPAVKGEWYLSDEVAMTWSPDGTKIALNGPGLSMIDADPAHAQAGMAPILASFPTSSMFKPWWSHDGRFLYVVVPHRTHDNPLSPSSQWGAVQLRVEISTGIITDPYQDPYKLPTTVHPL